MKFCGMDRAGGYLWSERSQIQKDTYNMFSREYENQCGSLEEWSGTAVTGDEECGGE